jgi:tetratricopeptide (TPR) repeat protein
MAIFLDKAIFLDEASVALTRFLIQQGRIPLLLVAECQHEGKPISWHDSFAANEMEEISLSPLSPPQVKEYLVSLLEGTISEALGTVLEKRSRGNPWHIEEVMRQLIDSGNAYQDQAGEWRYQPPKETAKSSQDLLSPFLVTAFTRRLEKLSGKSRDLLALAALLEPGPEFDFDLWLALLGGDSQRTAAQEALNEALERRFLRDVGGNRYVFRPADVSESLAGSLPTSRQHELHRQIAVILVERQGDPILIGYHYEQSGLATESARYLEAAGVRAMAANAINEAIDCYKRAVNLVETQAGYEALGNLYRLQGAWADSIHAFQRALELTRPTEDIDQQGRILNDLSFTFWLSDKYGEAYQSASSVLKLQDVSKIEQATAQSHLGMISWLLGNLKEAEKWCRKSVDILVSSGDEARLAAAYNRLGVVCFVRGKFAEARKVINLALDARRKLGDYWGEAYCLVNLGKVVADQGDFEQATSHFASAKQLFEKINSNDGLMVIYAEQGRLMLRQGKTGEVLPLLTKALNLAQEIKKRTAYGLADIYLLIAQASIAEGKLGRAKAITDEALKLGRAAGNREYIAIGQATMAQIHAARGEPAMAEAMYKKALTLFEEVGNPAGLLRTRLNYAHFLAGQGQTEAATELERETRDEATRIGLHL